MPVTIQHVLTATTPDNTSAEIRPSHWNSQHAVSLSLAGNEVIKWIGAANGSQSSGTISFSNSNGISFGINNGTITAAHNALTSQSVQTQGIQSISAGGNSVGGGQVVFSNSNGLAFGLNGSTITGSYTVPTQSAQSIGVYASSQTTGASSSSTVDARSITFVGAGGVSVGLTNGSVVVSGATGGGGGADGYNILAAGTQTAGTATTVNFANSNGITFGMSGSAQITASHNALTSQSAQAISAGNGSSTFQTISFGDSNSISFSISNGSIIASHAQSNQTLGMYAVSNTTGDSSSSSFDARTLSFQAAGIASIGFSNGSVVVSVPAGGGAGDGGNVIVAGTQTATTLGSVVFSNSNGVSFGLSGSTRLTASVAAQTLGLYAVSNTTQNSSTTLDARTISIQGAGVASVGYSNGSVVISVPAGGGVGDGGNVLIAGTQTATTLGSVSFADSNGISFGLSGSTRLTASHNGLTSQSAQVVSGANGSYAFQTLSFSNANGVSFGTSAGSAITASISQTAQTVGLYASSQTTGQSSSSTVDARSLSIRGAGNISVGLSGGEFIISQTGGAGAGGVNLSAGANSISEGLVVFSNANGVSFALNGSTITASHNALTSQSNQAVSAANGSYAFQTLSFSNANGISFGTSAGSAITASHNGLTTAAASNHSHGNPTLNLTNLSGTTASASNGLTLSLSAAGQTAQSIGIYGVSNTTGASSSSTVDARSLSIQGAGGVSVGMTNGSVVISGGVGSAQTLGIYGLSNTTVNSSGTIDARSVSIRAYGVLSVGTSNGSVLFSTPDPVDFTQLSVGNSNLGNTAGSSGVVTGRMVLVGSNNITLSGSTNGGSITLSVIGGAGGGGGVAISAGTQSASTNTIVFSNSNNISFGMSGSTRVTASAALDMYVLGNTSVSSSSSRSIQSVVVAGAGPISVGFSVGSGMFISGPAVSSLSATGAASISVNASTISIGVPHLSIYASSNTTGQSSSSSVALGSLSIRGVGNVSVGMSAGELIVSGSGGGGGGGIALSAGTQSASTDTVVFSNSNNIAFGMSGSTRVTASAAIDVYALENTTGQSSSTSRSLQSLVFAGVGAASVGFSAGSGMLISVPVQTNQSLGLYAVGNTTQNSSTTRDARTLSFNGLGAISVGFSNGSVQLSAPATSSLSGTGQVSIFTNGSTISIGVPNLVTETGGFFPYADQEMVNATVGQASLIFDPESFPNVQYDRVMFPVVNTNSSNSSGSHTLSFWVGLYTRNASTLSLLGSTSASTAITHSGTVGSYSLFSGMRHFTIGSTTTLTAGKYWMAFVSRTTSGGADGSYSNVVLSQFASSHLGVFGASANATRHFTLGQGYYSASTSGLPASVAFSEIIGSNSNAGRMQVLLFASSTV